MGSRDWGPLAPKDVATKVQFYVTGEATRSVALIFGIQTEPGTLPKTTCTGDAVDPLVSTIVTGGVFTGIENGSGNTSAKLKIPAKRFRLKKQFDFKLKVHWGPAVPGGAIPIVQRLRRPGPERRRRHVAVPLPTHLVSGPGRRSVPAAEDD